VTNTPKPKVTSYEYGTTYQNTMLYYYDLSKVASDSNTEYLRVVLANELIKKFVLPVFSGVSKTNITVVDIGCSVGLFAIEFSKQGYNSIGIDFDPVALQMANELNSREGTSAKFIQMDVSDLKDSANITIDIALCFDSFEHLHDDELGALLRGIRRNLSPNGRLVFHTLPMQYDYLFWNGKKGIIQFPFLLSFFKRIRAHRFSRLVKIYSLGLDMINLMRGRNTHKDDIKQEDHCNPLTQERLEDMLNRAGFDILFIESGFLGEVQLDAKDKNFFINQPITHRSLRGIASSRKTDI
jgi:2-polyprenyl-3-methyl-5-hydroxy-6-metoxy-1,4-benzoquinol methylase